MPKFGLDAVSFTSPITTADTAISITMGAAARAEVVELIMTGGGVTAAADTQHRASSRFCDFATAGTPGASPTPEIFDSGVAAAAAAADTAYTAEPTNINTVSHVAFGFNQRGGMRWAVPRGEGIHVQGGLTEDGLVFTVVSSAAGVVDSAMNWWE
jgi:hypothetical protein